MLTFAEFTGINNVLPDHRQKPSDLRVAMDVDIGLTGELTRRAGFSEVSALCHKNLHQAGGYMLATVGSVLTAIHPDGARVTIHPALGSSRVWYCNLPDGRTTYSNGLIHGITDGLTGGDWSIPVPDLADVTPTAGAMDLGSYRYHLTFVRLMDQLEGPANSSQPFDVVQGGVRLENLPERDGYAVNVYLSGKNGEGAYLAGTAAGSEFSYAGRNSALVLACRTLGAIPMPVGTIAASWRGRVLVAQGNVLWGSMPGSVHLCQWRDFKQFDAPITLLQPVDDGLYVGTSRDLAFLSGTQFDALGYQPKNTGPVALGSGVTAPGDRVKLGAATGQGTGMLCIAGGCIVAGFNSGSVERLTKDRYQTAATEFAATWREVDGTPQYLAVPQ